MGWRTHDLDPRLRKRVEQALHDADKTIAQVRKECPAPEEIKMSKSDSPLEEELHEKICKYCKENGYYFIHSRMDKRTTVAVGTPDFCIAGPHGKVLWLECKRKGSKATKKQEAAIIQLINLDHRAFVVDSWEVARSLIWTWVA